MLFAFKNKHSFHVCRRYERLLLNDLSGDTILNIPPDDLSKHDKDKVDPYLKKIDRIYARKEILIKIHMKSIKEGFT